MSDIVERLRVGFQCDEGGNRCRTMDAKSGCVCAEAADEITRLRAEVERLSHTNEAKREHRDALLADMIRLRAQNAELVAALRLFACDCSESDACKFPHACSHHHARTAIAKAEGERQ